MSIKWVSVPPLRGFMPRLRRETAQKALSIAEAVWKGAVDRTPVASGELRASWNLSQGKPDFTTVGGVEGPDKFSVPLPPPVMPKLKAGVLSSAKYFVSNGKKYAGYVEYGSPTTRPVLMLARAIEAVRRSK